MKSRGSRTVWRLPLFRNMRLSIFHPLITRHVSLALVSMGLMWISGCASDPNSLADACHRPGWFSAGF